MDVPITSSGLSSKQQIQEYPMSQNKTNYATNLNTKINIQNSQAECLERIVKAVKEN